MWYDPFMARQVSKHIADEIHRLAEIELNFSKIGRHVGIHSTTVKDVLRRSGWLANHDISQAVTKAVITPESVKGRLLTKTVQILDSMTPEKIANANLSTLSAAVQRLFGEYNRMTALEREKKQEQGRSTTDYIAQLCRTMDSNIKEGKIKIEEVINLPQGDTHKKPDGDTNKKPETEPRGPVPGKGNDDLL